MFRGGHRFRLQTGAIHTAFPVQRQVIINSHTSVRRDISHSDGPDLYNTPNPRDRDGDGDGTGKTLTTVQSYRTYGCSKRFGGENKTRWGGNKTKPQGWDG